MTQTYQQIDEFTVEKREYDFTTGPTYFVRLTGSDECITSKFCKTDRAVAKLVEKARAIVARKAAQKAATAERRAAKDAAKGVVRDECQICSGSWVIENGITSLHGYTRPGHGWLVGSCMGARELPFSKSCEVLKRYRESVVAYAATVADSIAEGKAGRYATITRTEKRYSRERYMMSRPETVTVVYTKGQPMPAGSDFEKRGFEELVKLTIANLESDERHAKAEIKRVDERLALWLSKFGGQS